MSPEKTLVWNRGLIAWMVHNRVTPNLLMIVLLLGGFSMAVAIKQEVYPEFDLDMITVDVDYPGASPAEVEQGIILVIEEAVRGLDGISEVRATAGEGVANVVAELEAGADSQRVYQDLKQEIDRITTLPEDAERPEVSMMTSRLKVLEVLLYGESTEWTLRAVTEQVRDALLQDAGITQVELSGARRYEVHVQIDQETLRRYSLTLDEVAEVIRDAALELPGGQVETRSGDLLLRVTERRDWAREFESIPITQTSDGSLVTLSDVAEVVDGFEETDQEATFNGQRAMGIEVYRVGHQTPIGVAQAVRRAMAAIEPQLPSSIQWTIQNDETQVYQQRLGLLLGNALGGLCLVMLLLGLFLGIKPAFWVTLGIPVSFLGAFLFLPGMGVTINMMSLFAFLIALGIVVDDAIVVSENIFAHRNQGKTWSQAAIQGTREVVVPVTFSVLTNVIGFLPLCLIPGWIGRLWLVIPMVVITVFIISLIESLLILPVHLAHGRTRSRGRLSHWLDNRQQAFDRGLLRFIDRIYAPLVQRCIRCRQLTLAAGVAILVIVLTLVLSGRIGVILMPKVESDMVVATATLPYGSPMSQARGIRTLLTEKARALARTHGGDQLCQGVFADIQENRIEVRFYLTAPHVRPLKTDEVARLWRQDVGTVVDLEALRFETDIGGPGEGEALTVELAHNDLEILEQASEALGEALSRFTAVTDIDDGFAPGKSQLNFTVTPEGQSLGLTAQEIARQVRSAFYGAEALRQQRGRHEVRIFVKLPKAERLSEYDVEQLMIRTPAGTDVPLLDVAQVTRGRSYTVIEREDGRRCVEVAANVEPLEASDLIMDALEDDVFPELLEQFPGLACDWDGAQEQFSDSMKMLVSGFVVALFLIYAMLAIPFRSYVQPMIIMAAVPFGVVGAILGHYLLGYGLSVMSIMGIVALSGVVVNDSLLLISDANERRREGLSALAAIQQAATRRFRPIILTTLTTFGGLMPMILETSPQGRFMIPMAISLGFGILFATGITLILAPCLYMVLDDAQRLKEWIFPTT